MKPVLGMALAAFMALTRTGTAPAAVNEAIAFHGFLTAADGTRFEENTVVKIDFKLYPSANAGAELLWARRIPVTLDASSGFYVDIMDTAGQSYQAAGGVTPMCSTLRDAMSRHAQRSSGPVWLAYEMADAKIATPMPRVPLYRQPLAQRASGARHADVARIGSVRAKTLMGENATVAADRVVVETDRVQLRGFTYDVPQQDVPLNPSGSVKLRSLTGLSCCSESDSGGRLTADLPAVADSDCGRVLRHTVGGAETLTAVYYSKGDSTAVPDGATCVYLWSFGPLVNLVNCLTFASESGFSLKMKNNKSWAGALYWSTDMTTWAEWNGEQVNAASVGRGGQPWRLYLHGDNRNKAFDNTLLMTPTEAGGKIACRGNIETLRGATGDNPSPTPMGMACYEGFFRDCAALSSAPSLPATELVQQCYASMFMNCTSLTGLPVLPANNMAMRCYGNMFCGCTNVCVSASGPGTAWSLPAAATATDWNVDMLKGVPGGAPASPAANTTYYVSPAK